MIEDFCFMQIKHGRISIFLFSLVLTLLFGIPGQVLACSLNPDLYSVCEMYGRAKAVFVGKIVGIKEVKQPGVNSDYEIIFQVQEEFTGVKKIARVPVILSGASLQHCGFETGKVYLVYAYKGDKRFLIDAGTRTKPLAVADEDIEFLRNLPNKKSGINIYGNVKQSVKSSLEDDNSQPLSGVSVKIENTENKEQVFRAKTDANGNYKIASLPAGSYTVSLDFADKRFVSSSSTTTKITDKGCVKQDVSVVSKSKITGKVIDADGNPVDHITVEIISINVRNPDYFVGDEFGQTDSAGIFRAYNISPGLYTVSVNYNNPPDDEAPFPPTFYPGVSERSQAQIFEVSLDRDIADLEFRLPPKLQKRAVSGSVVWADGTPAAGVEVYIKDHLHDVCCVNSEVKTDARGRFTIYGFEGRKYRVWATGKRNLAFEKADYGASPPFVLTEKTKNYKIILDETDAWLTDMDDDNEKESEKNSQQP